MQKKTGLLSKTGWDKSLYVVNNTSLFIPKFAQHWSIRLKRQCPNRRAGLTTRKWQPGLDRNITLVWSIKEDVIRQCSNRSENCWWTQRQTSSRICSLTSTSSLAGKIYGTRVSSSKDRPRFVPLEVFTPEIRSTGFASSQRQHLIRRAGLAT